ncbi:PaaI family thioesterase [Rhodococcoides fascians]|uniref:PaaI family thioesterase n=1 Tax=Rhodococcoides fascians TaxID=1828 RepID=UPI000A59871B|nr:hotdog domain-containing protein [Rhodococcus fascians]
MSTFVAAGAEQLLGIVPVDFTAERGRLTMASGPWFRDDAAGVVRSLVGVALDDVTGHVVAMGAPAGMWPVSLNIRLDFLGDPPTDGSIMSVSGELVHRDDSSGTTRGRVVDSHGSVIALVTQRSHLVSFDGPIGLDTVPVEEARGDMTFRDQLRFDRSGSSCVLTMSPSLFSTNGMGNVHGGILIAGSELAAMDALDASGDLRTTSVDISFVRPGDGRADTRFEAEIVHRGRSVAVVRVVSRNASGKQCSIATVTVQNSK